MLLTINFYLCYLLKSNMADDGLSDDELRLQLTKHGVAVGPVTSSTRPVLLRKLRSLRDSNGRSASTRTKPNSRRAPSFGYRGSVGMPSTSGVRNLSLNSFSSDESETDDNFRVANSYADEDKNTNHSAELFARGVGRMDYVDSNRRSFDTSFARPSIMSYTNGPGVNSGTFKTTSYNTKHTTRMEFRPQTPGSDQKKTVTTRVNDYHTWQYISGVLVVLVLIFAITVIASYFYIAREPGLLEAKYDACAEVPEVGCIGADEWPLVEKLTVHLLDILSTHAGKFDCGYGKDHRYMSKSEVRNVIKTQFSESRRPEDIDHYLRHFLHLLSRNPEWEVHLYNADKNLVMDINDDIEFMESGKSNKSLWCRLMMSVHAVFKVIAFSLLLVAIVVIVLVIIQKRKKWIEAERQEVYDLVERIIDMLRQNAEAADDASGRAQPYLAIPHVRDALIPLHMRQKKKAVWDQAVRYISENESRVRVENQKIAGEGKHGFNKLLLY